MPHQQAPLPQAQLSCDTCGECCITVGSLLHDRQALKDHLSWALRSVNQHEAALQESRSHCQELQRSLENTKRDHAALHSELHETKVQHTTSQQNLITQRERHTLIVNSLQAEIHTLWKLIEEMNPFPSNPNHQSTVIRELFHSNNEQQQRIKELSASNEGHRARNERLESMIEVLGGDVELLSEIEDVEQAEIQEV